MIFQDCLDIDSLISKVSIKHERPKSISRFYLPEELLVQTRMMLLKKGHIGLEEIVLWSGYILESNQCVLSSCILPKTESSTVFVSIPNPLEVAAISNEVVKRGQLIFSQVHTHPSYGTKPSYTDVEIPFTHIIGFLSIIIPNYAKNPIDLLSCGIYETIGLDQNKTLLVRPLLPSEIRERFYIFRDKLPLKEVEKWKR